MAILKKIQGKSTDIHKGFEYPVEFPVDDSLTDGIGQCKLFAVKGDGASVVFYDLTSENGVGATAVEADSTDEELFAEGLIVGMSAKDQYGALSLAPLRVVYPIGTAQEEITNPPVKGAIVYEWDDTKPKSAIYRTKTEALAGTVEVVGGALATVVGTGTAFDTALSVGDLIAVGGEVREVSVITSATSITVSEEFTGAITAGASAKVLTDFGRPVYLATAGDWTKIKPVTVGAKRQEAGFVSSGNTVTIRIKTPEIIK